MTLYRLIFLGVFSAECQVSQHQHRFLLIAFQAVLLIVYQCGAYHVLQSHVATQFLILEDKDILKEEGMSCTYCGRRGGAYHVLCWSDFELLSIFLRDAGNISWINIISIAPHIVFMSVSVGASRTSINAYSTGRYEDRGQVYEVNTKEFNPNGWFKRIIMTVRLTCSLPGGQSTDGLGSGPFWASDGFLMAFKVLGFSCVLESATTTIYILNQAAGADFPTVCASLNYHP